MKRATLNYTVNTSYGLKELPLDSASLYHIDNFTSQYKNDQELIKNYPNRDKILKFIRENNGVKGKLRISYTTDLSSKVNIPLIYNNSSSIVIIDDLINGRISEVENARKLLFNSKNQLFARSILIYKDLYDAFSYRMSVSYYEYLLLQKNGLYVSKDDEIYYIDFMELIRFRANNRRLGSLRDLYEDMLELWKSKMEELDHDELYYYSRQIRLLINSYTKISSESISVSSLNIFPKYLEIFKKRCFFRYKSPYLIIKSVNFISSRKEF